MRIKGSLYQPIDLNAQEATTSSKGLNGDNHSTISDVTGLQVTFLSEYSGIKNVLLPWPAKGNYYLDSTDQLQLGKYIYIKEEEGKWVAYSTKPAFFRDPRDKVLYRAELTHGSIYGLQNAGGDYTVFIEFINKQSNVFRNYRVNQFVNITIGRTPDNDIQYSNPLVSRLHATIRWDKNIWTIEDQNSTNGIYVNNKRVKGTILNPGDRIFIVGLRINIGIGFISINDGNGRISISSKLRRISADDSNFFPEKPLNKSDEIELFNRLPRKREPLIAEPIIIEAPPPSLHNNGIPLILRMGGSTVMGTTAMLAGHYTAMLSSVLFPLLTHRYTDKQKKEYEANRQLKYGRYLDDLKLQIRKEADHEKRVLNANYPELSQILSFTEDGSRLWERNKVDDDFLSVRIGYGKIPLIAKREFPIRRFDMDEDNLLDRMRQIAEEPIIIQNAPIMTSLVEDYICGITGNHELVYGFIKRLILQISILHSYDEVKLVILGSESELSNINSVRYLPHIWNDQQEFRFLATNTAEVSQISEYLKNELADSLSSKEELKRILVHRPYYVVFALNKKYFDSMEILKDIMQCDHNIGVTVITAFEELPKECMKVFCLQNGRNHIIQHLKQIELADDYFKMDEYNEESAKVSLKTLCNRKLRVVSQAYALPKMVTFLDMYGVNSVEQLNPLKRWKDNNPLKSLAAPLGIAPDGTLLMLDVHEKFQGPHGLIAGMTGSGKSELIITYILSMAVNYSPEEVAFILIDYKGGGLAGAFEDEVKGIRLPHLVGTITNLDGASIQRSLMSIQSELIRRQRIFQEVKSHTNEGTISIYEYQKLYRQGKVKKALPHLFIVADEFAELKKQEPDFMDQLISAARIGRSLGVHLILATQKPSGVVNDQIWGNSKFRICLRVQDRGDSNEMLKRPEAAELRHSGRFYLQVGSNEFFALGQSAWCGAEYAVKTENSSNADAEVELVDNTGQVMISKKTMGDSISTGEKQVVAIVNYITDVAREKGMVNDNLWTNPIGSCIGLEQIKETYGAGKRNESVEVVVGLVDDPTNQCKFPLAVDLQHARHVMAIGQSGCGKTTFVQTFLYEIISNYSPERANFYILDFSSHNLSVFGGVPHCGGVLTDSNENDIGRLLVMMSGILASRKKMFSDAKVGSYDAYLSVQQIPLIILVIDNIGVMSQFKKGRDYLDQISDLMRNGDGYGIKIVATAGDINDFPYRMQRDFGVVLALKLKDRYAYSNALNARCTLELPDIKGRGICVYGERCLEYQIALIIENNNEIERIKYLLEEVKRIETLYSNSQTAQVFDIEDSTETYSDFCRKFASNRIPLGYCIEDHKKVAIPLQQLNHMSVYIGNNDQAELILQNILTGSIKNKMSIVFFKRQNGSNLPKLQKEFEKNADLSIETFECNLESVKKLIDHLNALVVERTAIRKEYCEKEAIGDWKEKESIKKWRKDMRVRTEPVMIVIESMVDFQICLDAETCGILKTYMDLGIGYNIYYCALYYASDADVMERARDQIDNMYTDKEEIDTRKRELRQVADTITNSFNPDKFVLLFGGQFDKQRIIRLPFKYSGMTSVLSRNDYDKFVMHYNEKLVEMRMPCGDLESANRDQDDEDERLIV